MRMRENLPRNGQSSRKIKHKISLFFKSLTLYNVSDFFCFGGDFMGGTGSSIGGGGSAIIIEKKSALKDMTTRDQLSDYFLTNYNILLETNLKNIEFDLLKESLEGVDDMLQRYPEVKEMIPKIFYEKNGGGYAAYSWYNDNRGFGIEFNSSMKDRATFDPLIKKDQENGFHPKNDSSAQTLAHETAHALERYIAKKTGQRGFAISEVVVKTAYRNVYKEPAYTPNDPTSSFKKSCRGISGYAASNFKRTSGLFKKAGVHQYTETWAEAFADVYSNGKHANPFSKEIVRIATEYYKGNYT